MTCEGPQALTTGTMRHIGRTRTEVLVSVDMVQEHTGLGPMRICNTMNYSWGRQILQADQLGTHPLQVLVVITTRASQQRHRHPKLHTIPSNMAHLRLSHSIIRSLRKALRIDSAQVINHTYRLRISRQIPSTSPRTGRR